MNKIYKILLLSSFIFTISHTQAQRINLGAGNIASTNFFGPFNTSTDTSSFSRYAMIYPAAIMQGIRHGDTVNALDFERINAVNFRGAASCKIWMANTTKNDFGPNNIHFLAERLTLNAKLVFTGDPLPIIGSTGGYKKFNLDTAHAYDTTKGKNVVFFIEYKQDSSLPFAVAWSCDVAGDFPAYQPNQLKFVRGIGRAIPDSTNISSDIHPHIRMYIPRQDYEGLIIIPYVYGKIPVPLGNPDTIKLLMANFGKKAASNLKVFVTSRGANVFTDSVVLSSIGSFEEKLIKFPTRDIFNEGFDTLTFTLPVDSNLADNNREHLRLATQSIYSYRHLAEPLSPGGIGFNGSTGNFVAQFSSNSVKAINQVEVSFGFGGQPFRAGIWERNPNTGKPGKLLWQSDSLTSSAKSVIPVYPQVFVNGNFYVGVRQLGLNNVSFAYQLEQPVREQTFWYSAPLADTNWVDFAPEAPFRFMIEPRLQSEYDVMVFSIDTPKNGRKYDFYAYDTLKPTATIYNLGVANIDTPATFTCNLYLGNTLIFSVDKKDTIASGTLKQITFDTAHVFEFVGNYRMEIIANWSKDNVRFNDTLNSNFVVEFYNDIGPDNIFSPFYLQEFEYRFDSVKPVFRIRNYANNDQTNIKVRARILKGKQVLMNDSFLVASLLRGNSSILGGKNWFANTLDTLTFEAITALPNDRNKNNDTLRVDFLVTKFFDVKTETILAPANEFIGKIGDPIPRPSIRVNNLGLGDNPAVTSVFSVRNSSQQLIYSDTQTYVMFIGQSQNKLFIDTLKITKKGKYFVEATSHSDRDFETNNDTLRSVFYYGIEREAQADSIYAPINNQPFELNVGVFAPKATVSNLGYDSIRNTDVKLMALSNGVSFYTSIRKINLDSNQSVNITFDSSLIFNQFGNVSLRLVTLLANDQNPKNDTFTKLYTVQKSNDVAVDSVLIPENWSRFDLLSTFVPTAVISNQGLKKQDTAFAINCRILNPQGVKVYDETITETLDSGEIKTVSFIKSFQVADSGTYTVVVRVLLNKDQFLPNDFKSVVFDGFFGTNNKLVEKFPAAKVRYVPGVLMDTVHPRIIVRKTGENNSVDTIKVFIDIKGRNSNYTYEDSLDYFFAKNDTQELAFGNVFNTNIKDTFDAKIYTSSKNDGWYKDDSLAFEFYVTYGVDVKQLEKEMVNFIITPNPSNGLWKLEGKNNQTISRINVFDALGKKVFEGGFEAGVSATDIDLRTQPEGIYYLNLNDFKGQFKLIKINSK